MKSNYFLCFAITVFIFLGLTKAINIEKFSKYNDMAQLDILDHINVPTRAYCPTRNQSYDLRKDPVRIEPKEFPFYNSTRKNRCATRYLA